MVTITKEDIDSFYQGVQGVITQNLASNINEHIIDDICNKAKEWLKETEHKGDVFYPLVILSLEHLVIDKSIEKLEYKGDEECGLHYNNGTGADLSLEHGMWMLAMIAMSWSLMNLKGKVDAGSCHNLRHEHGAKEPRKCPEGSQFHKGFYDESIKSFEDIITIANDNPRNLVV